MEAANRTVHISDVATYLSCRAKWEWSSPLRMSMTTKEPSKHLWLGRVIHYALAAYYGTSAVPRASEALLSAYTSEAMRSLTEVKQHLGYVPEDIKEFASLGLRMMEHYGLWAPRHDDFEVIMPEVPLHVDGADYNFAGQTDGLIRDPQGRLWLLETKTSSRVPPESIVSMTWQGPAYVWAASQDPALRAIGPISGVLYNFLYKAAPTKPEVLSSGALSRRKNLRSTAEAYLAEVKRHHLDPDDYIDFVSVLPKGLFFQRYYITYSQIQLDLFKQNLDAVAKEMLGNPYIYPQEALRACSGCEFAALCRARYRGLAFDDLLDDFDISTHYTEE